MNADDTDGKKADTENSEREKRRIVIKKHIILVYNIVLVGINQCKIPDTGRKAGEYVLIHESIQKAYAIPRDNLVESVFM
jgi:hypothetical protein